jgi:uncharacterized protein (DUF1499 family)
MTFKTKRRIVLVLVLLLTAPVAALALISSTARRPDDLGVRNGRLSACPETPNCVCTQADEPVHTIEPIPFTGAVDEAMQRLGSIVANQPRATIVAKEGSYLHVEFVSRFFRFVDDVEFFVDEANGVIHFRSASRVGYSDLGANRKRMESIRASFQQVSDLPNGS